MAERKTALRKPREPHASLSPLPTTMTDGLGVAYLLAGTFGTLLATCMALIPDAQTLVSGL
jgi:hypothetical protein